VLVVAGSLAVEAHQASAQPATQGLSGAEAELVAKQQEQLDYVLGSVRRRAAAARRALADGDCTKFRDHVDRLGTDIYDIGRLPRLTRNQINAEIRSHFDALYNAKCPPKTEAETGLRMPGTCDTGVQVGAGPSVTQGVDVANGGFRTNHNVAGPKFEGTLRAPLGGCLRGGWIFEARGFGFDGDSSKNLSGSGTTFIQANGGTQPVAIAGPISSGRNEVGITQFGGEIKFKLDSPPVMPAPFQQTFQFTPFFGAGFEHIKVETRTSANWDPIAFFVTDLRETETNRVFLFAGGEINILNTPDGFKLFTFARGQLNLDFVEGSAFYHTAQAGIFNEFLEHHFRKTTFTVGGEVGLGASKTFAGGATAGVKVGVGALPIHRLEFHLGAPATLESEHRLNLSASAELRIPLTGPRPFDFDATRDLVFRY
jgi:hypothetical protein